MLGDEVRRGKKLRIGKEEVVVKTSPNSSSKEKIGRSNKNEK